MVTTCSRASGAKPRSCQKASTDSPRAATIVVQATKPEVLRENARMPTRPLRAAPPPGNRGMSQMYFISIVGRRGRAGTPFPPVVSPTQQVHLGDVDCF